MDTVAVYTQKYTVVHWVTLYVTGFTKTVPISTRNEIQFIADY